MVTKVAVIVIVVVSLALFLAIATAIVLGITLPIVLSRGGSNNANNENSTFAATTATTQSIQTTMTTAIMSMQTTTPTTNITQTTQQTSTTKFGTCSNGYVFNGAGCDACGLINIVPNVKIVGGIPAIPYSYPAQVLIKVYDGNTGFQCGGTLITRQTVMTAAHCTIGSKASDIDLYLGINNISETNDPTRGVKTTITKIIQHEAYNDKTYQNDIALLILSDRITLTPTIQLGCLPYQISDTYPPSGTGAWVAGWGNFAATTDENPDPPSPDELYNVKLNITDDCPARSPGNENTQVCAGAPNKDTCQGDSGGGLYVKDKTTTPERFIVAGIVSFGKGCGDQAGIYTRVSHYLDWIKVRWVK